MEIKFRGLRKDGGGWVYGDLFREVTAKSVCIVEYRPDLQLVPGAPDNHLWWTEVVPETVGLYTGLKDKNGVEIYEGDIIKSDDVLYCVEWDKLTLCWVGRYGSVYHDVTNLSVPFKKEIIGNRHENPEKLDNK